MRKRNNLQAFTLIELLVVISIIAVLMSIMLPALRKAREQARNSVCKSNLRQLAIAALTYEADSGRLPEHFAEIATRYGMAGNVRWPNLVGGDVSNFGAWAAHEDVRLIYGKYVDVNYFHCPFIKQWDKSPESVPPGEKRVYVDYNLVHGYWRDCNTDGVWSAKPWVHSSRPWVYKGTRMNVLISDRLYLSIINPQRFDIRANHPGREGFKYLHREARSDAGAFLDSYYHNDNFSEDVRVRLRANYAMRDGSVVEASGGDVSMIDVQHPYMSRDYTLMPSGFGE